MNLVYLSNYFGLPEVADFWEGIVKLNNWHQHRISKLIVKKLFGTVSGKKICILGFAFKANTNDTRESAAINICNDLIEEGAVLFIHDPKVDPQQIEKDLNRKENNQLKEEKGNKLNKDIKDTPVKVTKSETISGDGIATQMGTTTYYTTSKKYYCIN